MESPKVLTVPEVAAMARCSQKHVRDLLNRGELKGVKLGKCWRIPRLYALELLGITEEEEA